MFLRAARFNKHLNHMGQQFLFRRSYACPCFNPSSGAADPNHALCGGKGRLWGSATQGVAGVANNKTQREWAAFGQWESGDMVLSIGSDSPLYAMGQFDRVQMLNSTDPFSINLTNNADSRLMFTKATLERCFTLDNTGAIVERTLPAVDASGNLSWASNGPTAGQQFSLTGTKYVDFFCFGPFPSDRNEHSGEQLPRRAVLRRFDLFGRT